MTEKDYSHLQAVSYVHLDYDAYEYEDRIILKGSTPSCGCCASSIEVVKVEDMLDYLDRQAELAEKKAASMKLQASLLREHGPYELGRVLALLNKVDQHLRNATTFMAGSRDGDQIGSWYQELADTYDSLEHGISSEVDKALVYYRQLDSTGKAICEAIDQWTMEKVAESFSELAKRAYIPEASNS